MRTVLRALSVGKRSKLHVTIPPELALEEAKKLNKDVAAGEEAISPTELGVWVPTQLEIGLA